MYPVSTPKNVNVAAMLVAAAAILLSFVSSPNLFPPVPPGPNAGAITGTAIQLPALLTAIVAGALGAPGHSAPTNPGPS